MSREIINTGGNKRFVRDIPKTEEKKSNSYEDLPEEEQNKILNKISEEHERKQKSPKIKYYFLSIVDNLCDWLKTREHNPYSYKRRAGYVFTTLFLFAVSLVALILFYTNADKLNSIKIWIFKLAGVLLLFSAFFVIKYGWRLLEEIVNWGKRQRNWLKYLIIIVLIFLLWQVYVQRSTILNPVFDNYNKIRFSLFVPVDLSNLNSGSGIIKSITNIFNTDPEQYRTNPKTINLGKFNFVVYGGVNDYLAGLDRSISYSYVPPSNKDFIMRDLDNEIQRYYLIPFVQKIQEQTTSKKTQADMAISIVQGIPYDWEAFRTDSVTGRYPYEVLYDLKGVCMEKSDLLAFTLRELGFGVVIFEFQKESHRAVGIKCKKGNYNTDYCFIEATDYYPIGQIPANYVGGADIRNAIPEVIFISEGDSYN